MSAKSDWKKHLERAREIVETFVWLGDKDNLPHLIEDIASALEEVERPLQERVKELEEALTSLLEPLGDCQQNDHHGYCQSHYIENPCRVFLARQVLSKSRQEEGK